MNIISMPESGLSGLFQPLYEDDASARRAGLLSAYAGETREKALARPPVSSDSVCISETAMLLAAGLLAPDAPASGGDEDGGFAANGRDSAGPYGPASVFARARNAARAARAEAWSAGVALLAPLPPGGDDPEGPEQALNGMEITSSSSVTTAAFDIVRLQNRLRELHQDLSALEGSDAPDQNKAARAHSLTGRINRAMRDVSELLHRPRN